MPKSKSAPDFRKQKTKLGKGKQVKQNATDTSFKSRSIALPNQSILDDKAGAGPTTRRRLGLDDLLVQLKHYSSATRKDGLLGLRELLGASPELMRPNLSPLINALVRLIADDDPTVRRTLHSLTSFLLPRLPASDLPPYIPLLLLFTASALSHIFPEIRLDAVKFLDILIDVVPDAVVDGWAGRGAGGGGKRVLECYLALLNAKGDDEGPAKGSTTTTTASAMFTLTPPSRLIVLSSLASFLRASLFPTPLSSSGTPSIPTWPFASSFRTPSAYNLFASALSPSSSSSAPTVRWSERRGLGADEWEDFIGAFDTPVGPGTAWGVAELAKMGDLLRGEGMVTGAEGGAADARRKDVAALAQSLHATLVSTFLDCAPTVFSPSPEASSNTHLGSVCAVGKIARELYGALLREGGTDNFPASVKARENLAILLGHMAPYFPFGSNALHQRDAQSESQLQELNLAYCELVSLLVLASDGAHANAKGKGKARSRGEKALAGQAEHVCTWVVHALRGELTTPGQPLASPLPPSVYAALFPTCWSLLNLPPPSTAPVEVFDALLEHWRQANLRGEGKRLAAEVFGRIYLLQHDSAYTGRFVVRNGSELDKKLREWALGLPRLLWELGANAPPTSALILIILHSLALRRALPSSDETLPRSLAPFFFVRHPSRGPIPGPFAKLPGDVRRRALEVGWYMWGTQEGGAAGGALRDAVREALKAEGMEEERRYWGGLGGEC